MEISLDKGIIDFERFMSHLPLDSTDRVLVVLKGHLLVEEILREYVSAHVKHPKRLNDARFSFHHCLCLARAFSNDDSNEKLWDSIEKLNNLRNKLAHSLEPKDVDTKIKVFVELLSNSDPSLVYADDGKSFGVLSTCIFAIYLSLSHALRNREEYNAL